jgi:hypothetical protein
MTNKRIYNRVLVCGGRDFHDYDMVDRVLTACSKRWDIETIIHGAAAGADNLAGLWAHRNAVHVESYPADWDTYKKAAGPIRNRQMLREGKPDAVIAFPGNQGTAHMISISKKAGLKVFEV